MRSFLAFVGLAFAALFTIAALAIVLAFPTKWAWNYVMPYLFGFKTIDVWQALALSWLSGTLIKSSHTSSSK